MVGLPSGIVVSGFRSSLPETSCSDHVAPHSSPVLEPLAASRIASPGEGAKEHIPSR